MDSLLPCPFCGSSAQMWHQTKHRRGITYVMCDNTFCNTLKAGIGNTKAEREKSAVDSWNQRASKENANG